MRFSAKEPSTDEQSRSGQHALARALERGVNFVHSSYEYGTRWAVGEVMKGHSRRHDVRHVIKVPVPDFDDGGRFDAAKFRVRIEEALRELHTERIDVVQHLQRQRPNEDAIRIADIPIVHEPMLELFDELKREGKVSFLTTFPYTTGFAEKALETGYFSGLVAYYNPIEMEMTQFFDGLQERGKGFLCIRPFMGGLLTNRRVRRERLSADDRMHDSTWDSAYARLALVNEELGLEVESWTEFAIKFALIHPLVTSLIVGLNSTEQVDEVLDAADGNYPEFSIFERIQRVYDEHGPL